MLTDLEKLNQIRAILDAPAAPAAPMVRTAQTGPSMDKALEPYSFGAGVTAMPMPVEAGRVYTVETVGGVAGNGAGVLEVHLPDGSDKLPAQRIVNGYSYQHFQAQDTETLTILVDCDHPGMIRYAVV